MNALRNSKRRSFHATALGLLFGAAVPVSVTSRCDCPAVIIFVGPCNPVVKTEDACADALTVFKAAQISAKVTSNNLFFIFFW